MEISIAAAAAERYVFRRRRRDGALVRFNSTREFERLADGAWVCVAKPWRFDDEGTWQRLGSGDLRDHARRYLVEDFGGRRSQCLGLRECLKRRGVLRWIFAPLGGGAETHVKPAFIERSHLDHTEALLGTRAPDLAELREQALLGHRTLAERCAVLEQRANYFLGATALTSSLVLANAGLLIGANPLHPPWLAIGAVTLGIASLCAVVAGFLAIQAAMSTFTRCTPNGVFEIEARAEMWGQRSARAYVAALLVAQHREQVVGDWKLARLKSARRWFSATVVGVSALTIVVLADAVFH